MDSEQGECGTVWAMILCAALPFVFFTLFLFSLSSFFLCSFFFPPMYALFLFVLRKLFH
jgi:hypothetical protein